MPQAFLFSKLTSLLSKKIIFSQRILRVQTHNKFKKHDKQKKTKQNNNKNPPGAASFHLIT